MDFKNLTSFMDKMAKQHTVGNSVCVYRNNKQIFEYRAGYSDLENKTPLNGSEFYNIYSCSKIATVTAGIRLLEQGEFLLSDPLYEYIPEFKKMYIKNENGDVCEAKKTITVENLFTMSAGFSYDLTGEWRKRAELATDGKYDTVATIKELAKEPILYEPGTRWEYSLAHDVLAALISVVSGKKFRDYMQENIFEPIGMADTQYHLTPEIEKKMAQQYNFVPNSGKIDDLVEAQRSANSKSGVFENIGKSNNFIFGEEYDSGGAGIITTLSDYAKFAATLANGGTAANGEKIVSQNGIDLLRTNRLTPTQLKDFNWPQFKGFGYGLGVRTYMAPQSSDCIGNIGSFGWAGAAGSNVIIDPSINLAVFYTQHVCNPREDYYQPRLINAIYSDL